MQSENRLFDDFARMAGGALNVLSGVKTEIETAVRQQLEQFMSRMNLVTREEFEVVQAIAAKARDEQEALAARFSALQAEFDTLKKAEPPAKPARKAERATTTDQ